MIFETTVNTSDTKEELTIEQFNGAIQLYVTNEMADESNLGAGITLTVQDLVGLRNALNNYLGE